MKQQYLQVLLFFFFLTQEEEDRLIEDKTLRDAGNAKEIENPLAVLKGILTEVWYVRHLLL